MLREQLIFMRNNGLFIPFSIAAKATLFTHMAANLHAGKTI